MTCQHTIAKPVNLSGTGLHTGARVMLNLHPAAIGAGVCFVRSDVTGKDNAISAHALNVSTTQLGTNLTNASGVAIATVEHFLAACSGLGVDNLIAELDGPELPILDGSSALFCSLVMKAGIAGQDAPRKRLVMRKTVEVREGTKLARLSPAEGFEMRVGIDFASRAIGQQRIAFAMTPGAFATEIAYARTFGFARDVEKLRSMGLARGGSMDNAIVIDGDDILNPDGLQVPDEFVRHKLLDVVGDLFLAGGPIEGLYEGEQPGHALNNKLLRAVLADETAFAWRSDAA
jgi:UDP-3-O-[3-hydroxymyristoyl] N-acetylglucosamine deacetylase